MTIQYLMDEMEWLKPQKPFVYKSPAIYIQGPETSKQVGPYIAHMGKKPFIIGGTTALSLTEEDIKASYAEAGIEVAGVNRGLHLCTDKVIAATLEEAKASECDYVLGVGGGTIVDIARAVASKNEQYYAVVGTVASMAGFTSALSVIYNDDSTWDRLDFYPEDTHAVIMDSKIIAEGPVYHTINGMGDAFCIKWESEVVERGKNMNLVGGYATQIGLMIANECWNQLKRFGYQAVKANEKKLLTPALERIIETNTFMAGVGFESGALGGGHAIHDGLVGAGAIALHKTAPEFRPHGQVISYTTLTQLVMEDRDPAQIMECIAWCDSVGLAITWDDLFGAGKTPPDDQLWEASKMACSADKVNVLFGAMNITPAKIYTSLQMVDTLGHVYRDEIKPNMPPYIAPGMIPIPPRDNYFDRLTTI